MTALYRHMTNHCITEKNQPLIDELSQKLAAYEQRLAGGEDKQAKPVIDLCHKQDDLAAIESLAAHIRKKFRHVIICGSGGSGLSGKVLCNLNLYSHSPEIRTLDNIDPSAIEGLLKRCPPEETCVIAISKSGSTVETLSQFFAMFAHFKTTLGKNAAEHFITISTITDNPLRRFSTANGVKTLDHPSDIGGRFSLFTVVGLLPAAIAGLSIADFRLGGASVVEMLGKTIHPARLGAAVQYANMKAGKNMSVMLPYCERLYGFSAWYRQSWAESLGKGGKGTTPIRSVGTTDQHSQLQLYLDGPDDKLFTLIFHDRANTGQIISAPDYAELGYLANKKTGDIMAAEQKATIETLVRHGRQVRLIELDSLNEKTLGALLMHFMLEIFFMAKLLDINAFDQPAVEEGKKLARDYLLGDDL